MRDLRKHPITREEKLKALDWATARWGEEIIAGTAGFGDVTGVALVVVMKQIEETAPEVGD